MLLAVQDLLMGEIVSLWYGPILGYCMCTDLFQGGGVGGRQDMERRIQLSKCDVQYDSIYERSKLLVMVLMVAFASYLNLEAPCLKGFGQRTSLLQPANMQSRQLQLHVLCIEEMSSAITDVEMWTHISQRAKRSIFPTL